MALVSYTSTKLLLSALFLVVLTVNVVPHVLAARKLTADEAAVPMTTRHEKWMVEHGRTYKDEAEKSRRFKIFKSNAEFIDAFNAAGRSKHRLVTNKFADLTDEEFKARWTGYQRTSGVHKVAGFKYENFSLADAPDSKDWRAMGAVTPVKYQNQCGCCWAFSAVAAVEGIHKITTGQLVSLSEQQLLDCSTNGNNGCNGGLMDNAFQYIIANGGITTESAYPYQAVQGACQSDGMTAAATVSSFQDVPKNNEAALMAAAANQPVSVGIDGSDPVFKSYQTGIITADSSCGTNLDHAVTVVGYGTDADGTKYWVIKNSWGTTWGEGGYGRLERDVAGGGVCGLAMDPSYPVA